MKFVRMAKLLWKKFVKTLVALLAKEHIVFTQPAMLDEEGQLEVIDTVCSCDKPYNCAEFVVACDGKCGGWYHPNCVGLIRCGDFLIAVDETTGMETTRFNLSKPFVCPKCNSNGERTTYGQAVFKTPSRSNSTTGRSKFSSSSSSSSSSSGAAVPPRSAEQERDDELKSGKKRTGGGCDITGRGGGRAREDLEDEDEVVRAKVLKRKKRNRREEEDDEDYSEEDKDDDGSSDDDYVAPRKQRDRGPAKKKKKSSPSKKTSPSSPARRLGRRQRHLTEWFA
jgi:hypothetical protein